MKVFLLEDDALRVAHIRRVLPNADITHIESCTQVEAFRPPYDLILLDHDLGGRQLEDHEDCGLTFVNIVKDLVLMRDARSAIVIHSFDPDGAWAMADALRSVGERQVYTAPFKSAMFNRLLLQMAERAA